MKRGYRNNNPLNIRRGANAWLGLKPTQTDEEFCQFQSMAWGFRAAFRLLRTYRVQHGCHSIRSIISRFAPAYENNTEAYIKFVSKKVGVAPDYLIAGNDKDIMIRIVKAMSTFENGSAPRHEDVMEGYRLAFEERRAQPQNNQPNNQITKQPNNKCHEKP